MKESTFEHIRRSYEPKIPNVLRSGGALRHAEELSPADSMIDSIFPTCTDNRVVYVEEGMPKTTPLSRVGVLFSGGQAPGGHNVVSGIFDTLRRTNAQAMLYGFLNGPQGLIENTYRVLDEEAVASVRNTGGFDLIGSGRTKIESPEQFEAAQKTCETLDLDALVIVGGDDSNTNAALLAEYLLAGKQQTTVVGVPKTIDGDLKNEWIESSFGFDTATKIYSELISNIARDASSARKYWHFVKLMGRSASHIALECALATHPNVCVISEEVAAKKLTLQSIVGDITDAVLHRAQNGDSFGIVLLPEGLIEFIPEMGVLISELNTLLAKELQPVEKHLSLESKELFFSLPDTIQAQLLMDRDPHGNVQVSRIETERLVADMVRSEVQRRKGSISTMTHFLGYEGRAGFPSNFDADYCYALGSTAAILARGKQTGYIAAIRKLADEPSRWIPAGIPLRTMIHLETRGAHRKPVIKKALVELDGAPFLAFARHRATWAQKSTYRYTGPVQLFGPLELTDSRSVSLRLDSGEEFDELK